MTIAASSIQSFTEGQIDQNDAPHPRHFDRSEAEWRNLTPKCGKPMVAGDLSALRFIRAQSPCHPYRRVPPLEMTMPAGSIQSFPGDKLPQTLPRTPVISTAAERSEEISLRNVASPWWQEISRLCVSLEPKIFAPYRRVPPLETTMSASSIQSFTEGQIDQNDAPHPRHFDRSGAEWRNLTPKCGKPMVAGDLSALRFIRAQNPCHPYRRVPPLEMTMPAGSIQSFTEKEAIEKGL